MAPFQKGPPATQLPVGETGEAQPKRGPGRPRKDGSAPASKGTPRAARIATRDLKAELSGLLMLANTVASFIPPIAPDALDIVEIEALADAMATEAKRSVRFARLLDNMLQVTGGTGLLGIVFIIAARRVARHEQFGLTRDMDAMLGAVLAQTSGYKAPSGAPPAINADGAAPG